MNLCRFVIIGLCLYCCWRSNYQEGRVQLSRGEGVIKRGRSNYQEGRVQLSRGEGPIIKRGGCYQEGRVQLSRGEGVIKRGGSNYQEGRVLSREEGWDTINRFNPATFLCLSQARTWISNIICRGLFCV